jgi:drug/metabolite transporter (DMT)-like permease
MEKSSIKGYLYIAMASIVFAFQGVIGRYLLSQNIPALVLAFLKSFFGALILLVLMYLFRVRNFRIERKDIVPFILFGVIGVGIFSYCFFVAIDRTNITTAISLMYTSGAFTIIMASKLLNERITRNKLISVGVTFVGTLLVVVGYNVDQLVFDPVGMLAGVCVGAAYGFYNVNSKRFVVKYNTFITNFYSVAIAAVFLALLVNPVEVFTSGLVPVASWKYVILLAFMTYGVGYTLFIQGFKTVEAGRGAIIANIEPIISVLLARVLFQESMGLVQGTGFVLIFLAILITTRKETVVHVVAKEETI